MTSWMFRLVSKIRGLFGQKEADSEFDLETQTHLQLLTEQFIRQGMDPKDAWSAARRKFGNTTLLRQRHRESRAFFSFPNLFDDLRYGVRMFWKSPAFSLVAALTLALGIGATAAVFSLIQGVLLTPPPYKKPQQLMLIQTVRTDGQKMDSPRGWAAQQWMEWNQHVGSFQGMAGYGWTFNFLIRNDGSQSMQGMEVSKDYFRLMGLKTALGHGFDDSDFGQGHVKSIVLGYEFWKRAFGGDPQIIGKTVRISRWDSSPVVVGIMEPGVRFLPSPGAAKEPNYDVNATVDLWVPADPDPKSLKDPDWYVVGRLRDGVTPQRGQQELAALATREASADKQFEGFSTQLEPLMDEMNGDGRRILLPLLGAAGLVLLIACGNAAALLLVRGLQRQQEYAVRIAMGMGRIGLLRQILSESLLLAMFGGVLGVWVSHFRRKSVQGNCRACRSAPRWSNNRLGSFGVGTWGGVARCIFCGGDSGVARLSVESDGSAERYRAEGNGGSGREAAAARGRDAANRIDAGVAGGCGAADSHHDKNRAGSIGL